MRPKSQAGNFLRPRAKPVTQRRMADIKPASRSPWRWIPTLYVAEGLPYALVMSVAAVLYKNLDVPNAKITLWISLLG